MSSGDSVPTVTSFGDDILDRTLMAVERVRDRLKRATAALNAAQAPYAVVGGNAVARCGLSGIHSARSRNADPSVG